MGARATKVRPRALAQDNASKITAVLEAGEGHADLYRTVQSGPSGQRADLRIARVRFRQFGPDEFTIIDLGDGGTDRKSVV